MITYLVGGAVRDKLLGREVKDHDYVICNSSHADMLQAGYIQVGKEHSVYLHPDTKEEYSLAQDIQEDLRRRDLTINAMALRGSELIDPFHGSEDINRRVLRHVRPENFYTDPLRVYRLGRFSAELPDFSIDRSTIELIKSVANSPSFLKILPERIVKELEKVLVSRKPSKFFLLLKENNLLHHHFEELNDLSDKSFALTIALTDKLSVKQSAGLSYASLFAYAGESAPAKMSSRLGVSNEWANYATVVQKFFQKFKTSLSSMETVESFYQMDAYRNPKYVEVLVEILSVNGLEDQSIFLQKAFSLTRTISAKNISQKLSGKDLGMAIKRERVKHLESVIS